MVKLTFKNPETKRETFIIIKNSAKLLSIEIIDNDRRAETFLGKQDADLVADTIKHHVKRK